MSTGKLKNLRADQNRISLNLVDDWGANSSTLIHSELDIDVKVKTLNLVILRRFHDVHGSSMVRLSFCKKQALEIKRFLNDFYPGD